jgi:hypothetical protein
MSRQIEFDNGTFTIDREVDGSDPVVTFGGEYAVPIESLVDVLNFLVQGGYLQLELNGCAECEVVRPDVPAWPMSSSEKQS